MLHRNSKGLQLWPLSPNLQAQLRVDHRGRGDLDRVGTSGQVSLYILNAADPANTN